PAGASHTLQTFGGPPSVPHTLRSRDPRVKGPPARFYRGYRRTSYDARRLSGRPTASEGSGPGLSGTFDRAMGGEDFSRRYDRVQRAVLDRPVWIPAHAVP